MKIAYVGDFRAPHSTENYVAYGLRENGCTVFEYQETNLRLSSARRIVEEKPDFVLLSKVRIKESPDQFVEYLKRNGMRVVSWLFDLYVGFGSRPAQVKNKSGPWGADIVFSSDGGHQELFAKSGINHQILRQGIHAREAVFEKKEWKYDVIFVGNIASYAQRFDMIQALSEKYGERFKVFGGNNEVRGLDLNSLYQESKVVVGDSFPSKNYWSNRVYETIGRGGFLLHPKVDGLEQELEYYKHFVPFDYGDYNQLIEIIDYYLTHDEERERIRMAGFEYVKEHLTYTKRCQNLLQKITGTNG